MVRKIRYHSWYNKDHRRVNMKVSVLGGGSWGTAIANILGQKGIPTTLYIRNDRQRQALSETYVNERYLPGVKLDRHLSFTGDISEAVRDSDYIVLAVPTNSMREVLEEIAPLIKGKDIPLINLAKGLEEKSKMRLSQVAEELLPGHPFVVLSGPSHAEEVGRNMPTTVVVAAEDIELAREIQKLFNTENFRVYTQDDVVAVEMGAALKNIIALAAGLSDGLNFGDNTKAALMTRGIYEITKLGMKMGGKPQTFQGLSGIGDLIVTCTSEHSRNRNFGVLIGKGLSVEEAMKEVNMVVEGYRTTKAAYELSQELDVEMPITEKLYGVLYRGEDPEKAVVELMTRRSKDEIEEIFYQT